MRSYLQLMQNIVDNGIDGIDRTGVGTRSLFGGQLRHNLAEGFPLLTTKRIHIPSIIHEMLWFLSGSTNIRYLNDHGVRIWNEWADDQGELPEIYGKQWRAWEDTRAIAWNDYIGQEAHYKQQGFTLLHRHEGVAVIQRFIDQVSNLVASLKHNPQSRRHILSGWNAAKIEDMALPPCHTLYQFYVSQGRLSCHLYQRSADFFLGVPFNMAEGALLTHMLAQQCDLQVGDFIHSYGDVHLYQNHLTQEIVYEQLTREPKALPQLHIMRKPSSILDYRFDDFCIENYQPYATIKAQVAV